MSLWLMHLALPVQIWLPLGLALFAPLFIVAVALPISRRRLRGIATVLALRTVGLLALGFVILAALATFAVVHTGLRELSARHLRDIDALAESLRQNPLGLGEGNARLRMELFRAKDADIAIVAASSDACASSCLLVAGNESFDEATLRTRLAGAWPASGGQGMITIHGRPYLLIANSRRAIESRPSATVIAAIEARYLADQAAHTAWLLVTISYVLLAVVGWSSWQQVRRSLAARIHALNTQLLSGNVDESHDEFDVGGHELRELADSVSAYIKRTLEEKSSSDERYRRLVELAPDAVLMCADTRIRSANPAAIALAGASDSAEVIASTIDRFLKFEDRPSDGARAGGVRLATWTQLDGTALHVEVAEIADSIGGELVRQFVVRDITHSRRREADLTHRAEHDSLTGLVNRARFESRLRELLAPGGVGKVRDSSDVAVLFIDLDDFKPVNDTYGHAAGDAVLVAVAGRLRDSTRGTDLVARLGGDEFAVLLEVRDSFEADAVAQRILRALHLPIVYDGADLSIRASVGVANTRPVPCSVGGDVERPMTAAELLKAADAAMYAAKSAGGDRFVSDGCGAQSPAPGPDVSFPAMA